MGAFSLQGFGRRGSGRGASFARIAARRKPHPPIRAYMRSLGLLFGQCDRTVKILEGRLTEEEFAALAVERRELGLTEFAVQIGRGGQAVVETAVAEGFDH